MDIQPIQVDLLFETSWEVCNKIGGIYTVLSTKAKNLQKLYKDKVIFIGPDVWTPSTPSPYFVESKTLMRSWLSKADLPEGVTVRVGRWDIPGRPVSILVGFEGMYAVKDTFYGEMWQHFGVDSLHAYGDYDEACAFSHAAGIVIESICNHIGIGSKNVVAHFDEWTTGMGLLYTKLKLPTVATIFTTHATSIGRSICGNGKPLYDYLMGYNGDQMAGELNMKSKHSLEKAASHQADCFTTVSDVTGIECAQLLDKNPNIITPNGFEPNFVPSKAKMAEAKRTAKLTLLNVASCLTGKKFGEDTFIITTSGRCEYRNKGIDVYLDAVNQLKALSPEREILAFIMVPAWCGGPRKDLAEAIAKDSKMGLTDAVISHIINNPESDPVYGRIHSLGYSADKKSNLTIIYVPCYLDGHDGIFNKTYYELLPGINATVFPSYYEPWGYTPLESVAFGVPTVTTSLSGFGQWVKSIYGNNIEQSGVAVINRTDSNYWQVVSDIAHTLAKIANGQIDEKQLNMASTNTAKQADWAHFINYYTQAFNIALTNEKKRNQYPPNKENH